MQKKLKTISAYTESTDLIFKSFKKLFISWHCPFKSSLEGLLEQEGARYQVQN